MIKFGQAIFVIVHVIFAYSYYITYTITFQQYLKNDIFFYLHTYLFIISFISYYRASFTDAGPITVTKPPNLTEQLSKTCIKCNDKWKPPRAHHCKTCQKCVYRMDHHCEWINNCVGSHNHKYFILFLIYTLLLSVSTLALNLTSSIIWIQKQKRTLFFAFFNFTLNKVYVGSIIGLSVFFIIFTADFLYSQLYVLIDNQTTVESYKNVFGKPNSFYYSLCQIFGEDIKSWAFPTRPKLKMNYLELLYDPSNILQQHQYLENLLWDKSCQYYQFFEKYNIQ